MSAKFVLTSVLSSGTLQTRETGGGAAIYGFQLVP